MSIGDRIKQRRKELNLTQPQLAKILGVSKGTIGNYESNICAPNEKVLLKLFSALQCDANFLYQDNDMIVKKEKKITPHETEIIKKYRRLDEHGTKMVEFVLDEEYLRCNTEENIQIVQASSFIQIRHSFNKASAGVGFDLGNDDDWEEIEIPDTPEARRADFAVTVTGNSMEPTYYDGDIVLVKAQPSIDIGETGIFVINGSGYIKKNGGDRLISLNPEYKDILFSDGDIISCAGKVIGVV